MDEIDLKLLSLAEKGLPLIPQPFHTLAKEVGISPVEVLNRLLKLHEDGVIRRFGVSLKPNGVGFNANALVAWKVPVERIAEVAAHFTAYPDVTLWFERRVVGGNWEYNLYTVMHAPDRAGVEALVKQLSAETALKDYVVLYSTRNLKTKPNGETKKC
jgi:DNA-binding Lrp family transcriptional regulator